MVTAHVRQMSTSLEIAHKYLFDTPVLEMQRLTHEVSNEYSEKYGFGMLVSQGASGIRYWTGVEPELQFMRRKLEHIFGV